MPETFPDAPASLPPSHDTPASVPADVQAQAEGEAVSAASDATPQDAQSNTQSNTQPNTQPNPAEVAQQLKSLFPALFSGQVKPLKLRIQVDIQERAPGKFTKQALSVFFRRHTGSTSYLMAVAKAPHRFDLDGQPAGEIADEHRKVAQDELTRRRSNQESRRELDEQQRRNRAGLLHDFQITTLTKANFCALKGVPVDDLDGLLEIARGEAQERARQMAAHAPNSGNGPGPGSRAGQGQAPGQGPRHSNRDGDRPPRDASQDPRQRPSQDRPRRPGPPGAGSGPRRPR